MKEKRERGERRERGEERREGEEGSGEERGERRDGGERGGSTRRWEWMPCRLIFLLFSLLFIYFIFCCCCQTAFAAPVEAIIKLNSIKPKTADGEVYLPLFFPLPLPPFPLPLLPPPLLPPLPLPLPSHSRIDETATSGGSRGGEERGSRCSHTRLQSFVSGVSLWYLHPSSSLSSSFSLFLSFNIMIQKRRYKPLRP